jgi:hypothetical protein
MIYFLRNEKNRIITEEGTFNSREIAEAYVSVTSLKKKYGPLTIDSMSLEDLLKTLDAAENFLRYLSLEKFSKDVMVD